MSTASAETKSENETKSPFMRKYKGLLFCLLLSINMTLSNTVVKLVKTPATEKLFARACVQFLTILPIISYNEWKGNYSIFVSERRTQLLLIGRGISASAVSMFLYQGIQRIAIGDCVAISYCSAIFAGVFARIFLKDSYTLVRTFEHYKNVFVIYSC